MHKENKSATENTTNKPICKQQTIYINKTQADNQHTNTEGQSNNLYLGNFSATGFSPLKYQTLAI